MWATYVQQVRESKSDRSWCIREYAKTYHEYISSIISSRRLWLPLVVPPWDVVTFLRTCVVFGSEKVVRILVSHRRRERRPWRLLREIYQI